MIREFARFRPFEIELEDRGTAALRQPRSSRTSRDGEVREALRGGRPGRRGLRGRGRSPTAAGCGCSPRGPRGARGRARAAADGHAATVRAASPMPVQLDGEVMSSTRTAGWSSRSPPARSDGPVSVGPPTRPPSSGARAETGGRIEALAAQLAAIVDTASASSGDDEHDPEGQTIAYERAQAQALLAARPPRPRGDRRGPRGASPTTLRASASAAAHRSPARAPRGPPGRAAAASRHA